MREIKNIGFNVAKAEYDSKKRDLAIIDLELKTKEV